MYRLQYIDNLGMSCGEWFESEDEAMAVVGRDNPTHWRIRFVEFPFKLTRHSVGPMDEDSEARHILQWLNRWADSFRGF